MEKFRDWLEKKESEVNESDTLYGLNKSGDSIDKMIKKQHK